MQGDINIKDTRLRAFKRLLDIMDDLREKCPWDRKQTLESLRHLTIEEVYELSDAILDKDMEEIKKELGDVMLHLVFYAKIGSETNNFAIDDVLNSICEKLIVRHPHIYGDIDVNDADEVARNWELIKLKEKGDKPKRVLGGVPKSLPEIVKALRIQEKSAGVGFEWDNKEDVWKKVQEEIQELEVEVKANDQGEDNLDKIEDEFGDVMFSMINYARFLKVNPSDALERTNKKFISRFNYIEDKMKEDGLSFDEASLEQMDKYWEESKKK
ncbi:nucleoside triphosphate pyrophosphohydrolase [Flammeovirga yaeyamensis]|uniref:Nucleoside triphosphate pyrophosphohydrolase n=1 Tax=Flammeovirga yaeyamensis TaxID=367791 RepID=A0AAX1N2D7_9BACT|nr:nucleoside triphosphate pyrophosphohydrolase [Flammeovirga yaeyamensis]MBB3701135.1 XTP/dITP diphosphohydrolase [Flammeovirga yaeyamensis]QWG01602.1 nucleoside triphosphate pyrophosphohydrolase [Flammeovirga yaeyamensis]